MLTAEQKEVLLSLNNYYESGIDSIGHGKDDHIGSVITRAAEMATAINAMFPLEPDKKVNMDMVKSVAALHDIGNCISRSGHGHYGYGIVTGNLSPEEILDVAVKFKCKSKTMYATKDIAAEIKQEYRDKGCVDLNIEEGLWQLSKDTGTRKFSPKSMAKLETAVIDLTFQIGYNGIPPRKLRQVIAERYNVPDDGKIADEIYNRLVGPDGWYRDEALRPTAEEYKNIANGFRFDEEDKPVNEIWLRQHAEKLHTLTNELNKAYSPEEIKIIAEAVQDHNVDYHIPEKADKLDRYEARSPYGMIVADADKTADPVSELIRQMKFALKKLVPEGNKNLTLSYDGEKESNNKTGDFINERIPISTQKDRRVYIADMTAMLTNCKDQTLKRYDTLRGMDSYMQVDAKYGCDIGARMHAQIGRVADSIGSRESLFEKCYDIALGYLVAYGFNSSKAVMAREAEVQKDFDPEKDDFFSWSLDYSPKGVNIEKIYPVQMPEGIDERMDTLQKIDSELSKTGTLMKQYQMLEDKSLSPDTSTEEAFAFAKQQKNIRAELFRLDGCRTALQMGEPVKAEELKPSKDVVDRSNQLLGINVSKAIVLRD